jgi:deoxycytidylate deaminase
MIHAEMNALRYMRPGEGQLIAVTLMPCKECLKNIASYGIKEIAFAEPYSNTEVYDETETWGIALSLGLNLYRLQQVQ